MYKKILVVLLSLVTISNICFTNEPNISDEREILLLNYLQYNIYQIIQNPNQIVAEREISTIINRVKPDSLKNDDIIAAYEDLIDRVSDIKILEKQKSETEELIHLERQQALVNSMSGFNPKFFIGDPTAIVLNIAFAALNSGLNYMNSTSQANLNLIREKYRIEDLQIRQIDKCRANLYAASARVFKNKAETNYLINYENMDDFVKTINYINPDTQIADFEIIESRLLDMKVSLSLFPLYWFALGYAQQNNGHAEEALVSYNNYERIVSAEPIFKYDEVLVQLLFGKLDIYKTNTLKYQNEITHCIELLNEQFQYASFDSKSLISYGLASFYFNQKDYSMALDYVNKILGWKYGKWEDTALVLKDIIEQEKNGGFKALKVSMTALSSNRPLETVLVENNTTPESTKSNVWLIILIAVIVVVIIVGTIITFILKKTNKDEKDHRSREDIPHSYKCTRCGEIRSGYRRPRDHSTCNKPGRKKEHSWIRCD